MKGFGETKLAATVVVLLAVFMTVPLAGCTGNTEPGSTPANAATATAPGSALPATAPPATAPPATAPGATPTAPAPKPGRTVPIPAPSGGSINIVVPSVTAGPVTKVELNKTAALPDKISINVSKVEAITTKATTPGEIAGPALAMTVSIHNGSVENINVDSTIVTLTNSKNVLGQPTTSDPQHPFTGELTPGSTAQGVYVFLLPTDARTGLTLSVEYAAGQAIAQFVGDIS